MFPGNRERRFHSDTGVLARIVDSPKNFHHFLVCVCAVFHFPESSAQGPWNISPFCVICVYTHVCNVVEHLTFITMHAVRTVWTLHAVNTVF